MATKSIQESREFVIFQAFSQNNNFTAVLDVLEKYERENPKHKVFASEKEKKAMRDGYRIFKEAEKGLSRGGVPLDYDNPQVLKQMDAVLRQKLSLYSCLIPENNSASGIKFSLGHMLRMHAHNVAEYGKEKRQTDDKQRHEQARVGKRGIVGHSPYEKVISTKRTYKSNGYVIMERMREEQRQRRA